jgi:hypothetical protein
VHVVNPELIEVAEDHVLRVRDEVLPVAHRLRVVGLKRFAAFFHLDQDAPLNHEVGVPGGGLVVVQGEFDAAFAGAACLFQPGGITERDKQAIQKNLRFAFFIAVNVLLIILDKFF